MVSQILSLAPASFRSLDFAMFEEPETKKKQKGEREGRECLFNVPEAHSTRLKYIQSFGGFLTSAH